MPEGHRFPDRRKRYFYWMIGGEGNGLSGRSLHQRYSGDEVSHRIDLLKALWGNGSTPDPDSGAAGSNPAGAVSGHSYNGNIADSYSARSGFESLVAHIAPSSKRTGHSPFKAEMTGSSPAGVIHRPIY